MVPRLVSFPILTRALSTGDYGTLSLLMLCLTLTTAIGKLGLQHSAVRFYSEAKKETGPGERQFYSTIFITPLLVGGALAVFLALSLSTDFVVSNWLEASSVGLFTFTCLLIPIRSVLQCSMQIIRAEQRTKLYNVFGIILTYVIMIVSVFLLFYVVKGIKGYVTGMLIGNGVGLLFVFFAIGGRNRIRMKYFSSAFLKEGLYYGLPMVFVELEHTVLSMGDRFLIQYYLGSAALGVYSVGYNLTGYVGDSVVLPFRAASAPIMFDIWSSQGAEETKAFLSKSLRWLVLVLVPIGFGFVCVGKEFVILLASSKYTEATTILPWVTWGVLVYGTRVVLDGPLYIMKKTNLVMILMLVSCCINLGLNVLMIPKLGIVGAAIATLIANIIHVCLVYIASIRLLYFPLPIREISIYTCAGFVMYFCINTIQIDNALVSICSKTIIGATIYFVCVMLFDSEARAHGIAGWKYVCRGAKDSEVEEA